MECVPSGASVLRHIQSGLVPMEEAEGLTAPALPGFVGSTVMSHLEFCLTPRVCELASQSNLMIKLLPGYEWEVDIEEGCYAREGFLANFDSLLRRLHALQTALNHWWGLRYTIAGLKVLLKLTITLGTIKSASLERPFEDIIVILALLSLVYQYLTGNVDDGGAIAYSATSLDFRDIFISIVLFQGSYVWIKFREVAGFKGVVKRQIHDKQGNIRVVFEPRFKPPRENGKKYEWIYITQCATPEEAFIVYQIAAFYYNKAERNLDCGGGHSFLIPLMSLEEQSFSSERKKAWLPKKVREVYEEYKKAQEGVLLMDLTKTFGNEETQGSDGGNVDHSQGLAVSNRHNLGFQEGAATPIFQLTPNSHSGMNMPTSNQLDMILSLVSKQQELISNQQELISQQREDISYHQKQLQELKPQFSNQQQRIQELEAQISELKNQQVQHQPLQEAMIQISRLQDQRCLQQQQQDDIWSDIWNEVERMPITLANDGTEALEASHESWIKV